MHEKPWQPCPDCGSSHIAWALGILGDGSGDWLLRTGCAECELRQADTVESEVARQWMEESERLIEIGILPMAKKLNATLTCPECGTQKTEIMPVDACWYFYTCTACHAQLRPRPGDCCVFCSYGDVPCPPRQAGSTCCS
jgi:hypothetical protein